MAAWRAAARRGDGADGVGRLPELVQNGGGPHHQQLARPVDAVPQADGETAETGVPAGMTHRGRREVRRGAPPMAGGRCGALADGGQAGVTRRQWGRGISYGATCPWPGAGGSVRAMTTSLHQRAVVADTHNDLLMAVAARPPAQWAVVLPRALAAPAARRRGESPGAAGLHRRRYRPEGALRQTLRMIECAPTAGRGQRRRRTAVPRRGGRSTRRSTTGGSRWCWRWRACRAWTRAWS